MTSLSKYALAFVLSIIALLAICSIIEVIYNNDLSIAIASITSGLLIFCLAIILTEESGISWISSPSHIRATLAISIVIEYLILVGFVTFIKHGYEQLAPITQTFVTNFTTIVGVVIAFYFGASVYLQRQERQSQNPEPGASDKDAQKS